jgi:hypothetical protein
MRSVSLETIESLLPAVLSFIFHDRTAFPASVAIKASIAAAMVALS